MYNLRITVEEVRGFCDLPMRPGDYFEVRAGRLTLPAGGHICMWALAAILPMLPAKERATAEPNDWIPTTHHMCCPDPNGMVIYRIDRIGSGDVDGDQPATLDGRDLPPRRLLVNERLCSGCLSCELACSAAHNGGAFRPALSRIRVAKLEEQGIDRPSPCRQCGVAACVAACPQGALSRHPETRAVLLDAAQCIACGACADACKFGAIHPHPETGLPLICDLCGGDPKCVKRCSTGALKYGRAGTRLPDAPAEPFLAPPPLPPEDPDSPLDAGPDRPAGGNR